MKMVRLYLRQVNIRYYGVSSSDTNEPNYSHMLGGRDVYDGIETYGVRTGRV